MMNCAFRRRHRFGDMGRRGSSTYAEEEEEAEPGVEDRCQCR